MPRVSLGLPVYNGERHLASALDSLLGQSYRDLEVVVGDNASTDRTPQICRNYAERDPRLRYERHERNLGAAPNYNHVFRRARGELFKWAAHDDVLAPEFVARCVEALDRAGPGAVLAFPRVRFIDAEGRSLGDYEEAPPWHPGADAARRMRDLLGDDRRSHLHRCFPVSGLIRVEALRGTRLIQSFPSADAVLLLELALRGDWVEVPERLFHRRVHAASSRSANPSARDLARWFDRRPGTGAARLPRTLLQWAYLRAVLEAPLPLRERLRCLPPVLRRALREGRVVAGELRRALGLARSSGA